MAARKRNPAPDKALRLLHRMSGLLRRHGFILAGGTGLALQIRHRLSQDLDFFTSNEFSTERLYSDLERMRIPVTVLQESQGTLTVLADSVKTSFFQYSHRFAGTVTIPPGVQVASLADIAAMKVVAIAQRGTKRDFVDLYWILQEIPFWKIADRMVQFYGKERVNPLHLGKALVHFADAESDPDPRYLGSRFPPWDAVKRFFRGHVRQMVYDLQAALQGGGG